MISTKRSFLLAIGIIYFFLGISFAHFPMNDTIYIIAFGFAGGYILNDVFPSLLRKNWSKK